MKSERTRRRHLLGEVVGEFVYLEGWVSESSEVAAAAAAATAAEQ